MAVVQSLSQVRLFETPWTEGGQASLSFTNSQSLLKLMSTKSVMHPAISPSVVPFSSCLQSLLASGFFLMSQLFASGGQSIGASASASILPMNIGTLKSLLQHHSSKHQFFSTMANIGKSLGFPYFVFYLKNLFSL